MPIASHAGQVTVPTATGCLEVGAGFRQKDAAIRPLRIMGSAVSEFVPLKVLPEVRLVPR